MSSDRSRPDDAAEASVTEADAVAEEPTKLTDVLASPEVAEGEEPEEVDPLEGVTIIDRPETRVHRFTDLIAMLGTILGVILVLLLGAYAHSTTQGFTEDVQGIAALLQRLLVAPVNIFSGIVTLVVPAAVIIDLAVRREPRRILEVLGAAAIGFIATLISAYTTLEWGDEVLLESLSVPGPEGEMVVQLPAYLAGVAAMLTAAGMRTTRRVLRWSWNLVWIASAVAVISGIVTLPAAIATVLIGRAGGLLLRYMMGSTADRAYGEALVDGIRRAGFDPQRVMRADPNGEAQPAELDAVSAAVGRTRSGRIYAVKTVEGHHLIVVALDGDQHAAGFLTKLWNTLRFRGLNARAEVSLRHTAEATALVSHAARTAGVRTARVLGMSQARDTMILVYQRPAALQPLSDLEPDEVTDELLDALWAEVRTTHAAGISHRSLSADTVLVGAEDGSGFPAVWLTSWELGEVASASIARRIDDAQVLALTAVMVGPERAADAAFRAIGEQEVEQIAPLLQTIVMPRSTRHRLKTGDKVLEQLRSRIVQKIPDADVEQQNIVRFGLRTVLMFSLAIIAVVIVFASFNTQQVIDGLREANPVWLLVALGWSLLTFVGAALALIAFAPVKLPWNRVLLAQVAAAYLALAVPAGVGPAALNLRLLTRRKVASPMAVATVALVQVSAIVVTVVGLLVLTLVTGSEGTLAALPSSAVLIGVGITAAVIAASLTIPKVRAWAKAKVMPTLKQTWPRLVSVLSEPWRLLLGLAGNLIQTAAYVGAFYSVLQAFGQDLAVIDVAVLFFLSNAVGAAVPTPGGIGAVELALTAGLTGAGLGSAVALSVTIIYRFITYWLRIPLGFVAMKYLQKKGEL